MSKKAEHFLLLCAGIFFLFLGQILYLEIFASPDSISQERKKHLSQLIGLGGIAVSENSFLRHPFLNSPYKYSSVDGALREHAKEALLFEVQRDER